jgi:predicted alpha/beta hydrolase family esterase
VVLKAIILHGTMGTPEGNWFPWRQEKLKDLGVECYVPRLPTPEGHNLENWLQAIEEQAPKIDEKTILIGHSCGANCVLHILERLQGVVIPYVALCGTVIHDIDNEEIDTLNTTFVQHRFNWPEIKNAAKHISLFHGDDDPYVPLEQPQEVAKELNSHLTVIEGGGHLNSESGYIDFSLLVDDIAKLQL